MTDGVVDMTKTAASRRRPFIWLICGGLLLFIGGVIAGRIAASTQSPRETALSSQTDGDDAAIASYRQQLQRTPKDSAGRLALALLLERRDRDDALRELRQIASDTPEFLAAARHVARISLDLERDDDAIGPLKLLEQRDPGDAAVQQALAEILFRQQQFEESLKHANRCLERQPGNVAACLLIAETQDNLGHADEMIAPLQTALRLDPELPQAHLNLAYAYEAMGQSDAALPHVNWFLARYPDSIAANRTLAMVQRSRGQYEEGLAAVQQALKAAPGNLECRILAAEILLYLRRPQVAFDSLNELTDEWPRERRLLTPLLRAATMSRHVERAREIQARLQQIESRE